MRHYMRLSGTDRLTDPTSLKIFSLEISRAFEVKKWRLIILIMSKIMSNRHKIPVFINWLVGNESLLHPRGKHSAVLKIN